MTQPIEIGKLFVSYEIAEMAKEKGFDEPCLAEYHNKIFDIYRQGDEDGEHTSEFNTNTNSSPNWFGGNSITAPMFQQLVDWFREKHNIELYCPNYYKNNKAYKPEYECRVNGKQLGNQYSSSSSVTLFPTYYEALTVALTEAFKLILAL